MMKCYFFFIQTSGLPLKLSAKFQINMAMSDVHTMAHVEKFSHLTIPMLWFEIGLTHLPDRLQQRFSLYLNIGPAAEHTARYGSLILGAFLSIYAVTQVALITSRSFASQRCRQKFNKNLVSNSVYNACEEKLITLRGSRNVTQIVQVDEMSKSEDETDDGNMSNVISRNQYELEDDDALSDIDYNEIHDEDSTSNSSELVCKLIFSKSSFS